MSDARTSDERQRAHDEYLHDLTNAWRGNSPAGASKPGAVGAQKGDVIGHADQLTSVQPEATRQDSVTIDEVYAAKDEFYRNAWRNP